MTESLLHSAQITLAPAQQRDVHAMLAVAMTDPVSHVVPLMHIEAAMASSVVPQGLWAVRSRVRGRVETLGGVWCGANLCTVMPAGETARVWLWSDLAAALVARVSRPAALVGPAASTLALWDVVKPAWQPAREVRPRQVSMAIDVPARAPRAAYEPLNLEPVRCATMNDYDALLPACVHMFIGEVGYDPMSHGRASYEARLRALVRSGMSFLQYGDVDGRRAVVFKAEVGAVGGGVAQVQGVWVHPSLRGRGVARSGMAEVVNAVRERIAPTVSLYVNDFNVPALAVYEAVGMRQVGIFATVMF